MNARNNKKLLYGVIALLLVAAAIFFAVYNAIGTAYNYTRKDLSKFITISDAAYLNVSLSALEKAELTTEAVHEALAAALKATIDEKKAPEKQGMADGYDILSFNYWATYEEGGQTKIAFNQMDPAKAVSVQLKSADELYKLLGAALETEVKADAYNTVRAGFVGDGDVAFITYVPKGGQEGKNEQFTVGAGMEATLYAAIKGALIGTELVSDTNAALKDAYDSVKVNWVVRTELDKDTAADTNDNKIEAGDLVFATVTTKDTEGKTVTYYLRVEGGQVSYASAAGSFTVQKPLLDAILASTVDGTGKVTKQYFVTADAQYDAQKTYYTKTTEGEVDTYTAVQGITEFAAGTTYYEYLGQEYDYTVTDVYRAGATNIKGGLNAKTIVKDYDADSTAKAEDGTELKGKSVTFHIVPVGVLEVPYDAKALAALTDEQNDALFSSSDAASTFASLKDYSEKYDEAVAHLEEELKKTGEEYAKTLADYLAAVKAYYTSEEDDVDDKDMKALHKSLNKQLKKGDLNKDERESHISAVESNFAYVALYVKNFVKSFEENEAVTEAVVFADVAKYVKDTAAVRPELLAGDVLAVADLLVAYEKAVKALDDAVIDAGDADLAAFVAAVKVYVDANSDVNKNDKTAKLDALLAHDAEKQEANRKLAEAVESTYKAYYDGLKNYLEKYDSTKPLADVLPEDAAQAYMTEKLAGYLWDATREVVEEDSYNDYYTDVAKAIWTSMWDNADVDLPARAVRLAYKDVYKAEQYAYYTSTTIDKEKFPTFQKYMINVYGEDYKDDLKAQAEAYVKEQIIIFYLAEKTEAIPAKHKDFEDAYMLYLYNNTYYGLYLQIGGRTAEMMYDQLRATFAFDSLMQTLLSDEDGAYQSGLKEYQSALRSTVLS